MARAIEWALVRPASNGGKFLSVNAGSGDWNFQVRELAEAVAVELPGTRITINRDALPDKRSYRVDFSLFRSLAPNHQPRMTLPETVRTIRDGLMAIGFSDAKFRDSEWVRLLVLDRYMREARLSPALRWIEPAAREDRLNQA